MSGDSSTQDIFSPIEIDTIGEIMNISMGSAATAASTLLDNKVTITTPVVEVIPVEQFSFSELEPAIAVEIQYVEGISGSNILILKKADMRAILSQMMMTELPEDFEIDDMSESAICELMNQMMGSSATVLSCFLGRTINISTPNTVPISGIDVFKETYFSNDDVVVSITFTLTIKDSIESVFLCAMKANLAKEIIDVSLNFDAGEGIEEVVADPAPQPQPEPPSSQQAPTVPEQTETPPLSQQPGPSPASQASPVQAPAQTPPKSPTEPLGYQPPGQPQTQAPPQYPPQQYAPPQQPYGYPYPPQQYAQPTPPPGYDQQPVQVKDYNYGDFVPGGGADPHGANMDLVMNVPVVMTVELGRTRRKIKEILEFGQGTIVELDKQAGSQVDVIVNGQLIAHGDVVVVDDNFSIRITEIIKNNDPMSML